MRLPGRAGFLNQCQPSNYIRGWIASSKPGCATSGPVICKPWQSRSHVVALRLSKLEEEEPLSLIADFYLLIRFKHSTCASRRIPATINNYHQRPANPRYHHHQRRLLQPSAWRINHRPTNKCKRNPQAHPKNRQTILYMSQELEFRQPLAKVWKTKPASCLRAGSGNTIPRSIISSSSTQERIHHDRSGIIHTTTSNISAHLPRKKGSGCKRPTVRHLLRT
jgi:hypothetical protein